MSNAEAPRYKRILLKLSGEAISNGKDGIINRALIKEIGKTLRKCMEAGVQIGVIVGAGNIWRGRQGEDMDQVRADYMGMLATCINALALQDAFVAEGIDARVMTAMDVRQAAETYTRDRAVRHLEEGKLVIFGGGLGSPFFSTDTAAAVRAAEIGADAMLMAKNIDGIYTDDPAKNPDAKRLDCISCREILSRGLRAIDSTAAAFCMDNHIPIMVFGLDKVENIYKAVMGQIAGTVVS